MNIIFKEMNLQNIENTSKVKNSLISLYNSDNLNKYNGRVLLFFKADRSLNIPLLYKYLKDATEENIIDAFLLSFYIRNCRGGNKGERKIGRYCLIWLFINKPEFFMKIVSLIPEYGRWDDLLEFFPNVLKLTDIDFVRKNYLSIIPNKEYLIHLQNLQKKIVKIFASKLKNDRNNMLKGNPCSLIAKWSPTERDSLDRQSNVFKTLANEMGVSNRTLRKEYISPLRSYLKIVEIFMCSGKWNKIDYNNVPYCAMKKLKKSFKKHDKENFKEWENNYKKNINNYNSVQLYPHEIIKRIRLNKCVDSFSRLKWEKLEEDCILKKCFQNDVAVVDTSTSMHEPNYLPQDIAISMGLLISKCSVGKFKNMVLTFNYTPKFVNIKNNDTLYKRWQQIKNIDWGGNTNLQITFDLILQHAKKFQLSQKDIPKRLWIISDMNFDMINSSKYEYDFKKIKNMYDKCGYIMPQMIFWNVNADNFNLPIEIRNPNTILISGFSLHIMKAILLGKDLSTYQIMRENLDHSIFDKVRINLSK